jgi:hypothetical protein
VYNPFLEVPAGMLKRGSTDPAAPDFNSLAMWQAKGNVVELRIPWMLLGFTDPSSRQVMSYGEKDGKLTSVTTEGIRLLPWINRRSDSGVPVGLDSSAGSYPVSKLPMYTWPAWDKVQSTERLKISYTLMQEAFLNLDDRSGHER